MFTHQKEDDQGRWITLQIPDDWLEQFVPVVSATIRRIWKETDVRQRDWYFYRLRDKYQRLIVKAENPYLFDPFDRNAANRLLELERISHLRGDDAAQRARFLETWSGADLADYVPPICPFEAAIFWLQTQQKLMRFCPNPLCWGSHDPRRVPPGPWFFRTRKSEKYCSSECGNPARREAKRLWWAENRGKGKHA
jgi:hypothetical protein